MNRRTPNRISARPLSTKAIVILALLLILAVIEMALIWWQLGDSKSSKTKQNTTAQQSKQTDSATAAFNKSRYSTDEATSIWVVVNKGRTLPSNYLPPDLVVPNVPLRTGAGSDESHMRRAAAIAMETMFAAAAKDNIHLRIASAYRSYGTQSAIFAREVKTYGLAIAESESARAGHSEHQTGLAADIEPSDRRCEIADCFAATAEGKWLAANSYKYGFILRYPKGKESLTGYKYEPWHYRYVGTDLAAQIKKTGQTLEQFFGLPAYTSYQSYSIKLKS